MARVRVGKDHARFPPGYSPPAWVPALFKLATLSRRVRALFFGLPRSRARTWLVAAYYQLLVRQLRDGDLGFVRAVAPDAELDFFTFGTYRSPEGWKEALHAWRDSFSGGFAFELMEFLNPDGNAEVLLEMRMGGRGGSSGISIEDVAYFAIRVEGRDGRQGAAVRRQGRGVRRRRPVSECVTVPQRPTAPEGAAG